MNHILPGLDPEVTVVVRNFVDLYSSTVCAHAFAAPHLAELTQGGGGGQRSLPGGHAPNSP